MNYAFGVWGLGFGVWGLGFGVWVWSLKVVGRVDGWDVLGRAAWAETELRSVAEPYIEQSSD